MNKDELQKAHSAALHLKKMAKAVSDYHSKVVALHKAHHDDMQSCFAKMHKILGVEEAGGAGEEVPAADSLAGGTQNTVDFGKAAAAKTTPETQSSASSAGTPSKEAAKAAGAGEQMTKTEVEEVVQKAMTGFMTDFIKALKGEEGESSSSSAPSKTDQAAKAAKATPGIGDRGQQPVIKTVPVTKDQDNFPTQMQQPVVEKVDVAAALGGDRESALKLMRGVQGGELPATLVEPLSKLR